MSSRKELPLEYTACRSEALMAPIGCSRLPALPISAGVGQCPSFFSRLDLPLSPTLFPLSAYFSRISALQSYVLQVARHLLALLPKGTACAKTIEELAPELWGVRRIGNLIKHFYFQFFCHKFCARFPSTLWDAAGNRRHTDIQTLRRYYERH